MLDFTPAWRGARTMNDLWNTGLPIYSKLRIDNNGK